MRHQLVAELLFHKGDYMESLLIAILEAAGVVYAGSASNEASAKAQKEARRLAAVQRADDIAWKNEQLKLQKESAKLARQGLEYSRDAELYSRGERAVERGMVSRNNTFKQSLDLVNSNETLKSAFLANWKR